MLINKIKKFFSGFNLIFIYSAAIFLIILVTLMITSLTGYYLVSHGYLKGDFYESPYAGLILVFFLSILIGILSRLFGMNILIKPLRMMVKAMKELAQGNFNVQIELGKESRPWELTDFFYSFNETAKELRSIDTLRSDFVNNFSHEYKTPIVSIKGFAELLKHEDLTPEQREEYLDIIINESDRLAKLATNVLNLSKIEKQAIVTNQTTFNLSEQIRNAIVMLEPKWLPKGLDLAIDLLEVDGGDIFYNGNTEILTQVWVNLLDNAIKFSSPGGKLEVRLTEAYDKVVFEIQDHGCGMDAQTQARIFEKFYRAQTSQYIEGSGLGMTIVQKIVALTHGQIAIKSELDQGTLVSVSLPKELKKNTVSVSL